MISASPEGWIYVRTKYSDASAAKNTGLYSSAGLFAGISGSTAVIVIVPVVALGLRAMASVLSKVNGGKENSSAVADITNSFVAFLSSV